ncbi:MAG TPA: peptide chain release factor N(5)-glutamine methyltransferase [Tepidisphaeraceae bacterium]|jgi:release factor glutamine methyltransferase|nr:peptide chain release factor N(5)-glutamine methyltransferase [Tepidisphaeraceae bacterium]
MADGGSWTVRRILEWTTGYFTRKDVFQPRLSAEHLLAHILKYPRIKLYTDYDRVMNDAELAAYRALVTRAVEDEPIAYLTGRKPFFNLEFEVTRDVLIPRPDTETLVENVLQFFRHQPGMESPRVLDLCTGSGCIAAAIAHHHKSASVVATEISPAAAAVARRNFERLGLAGRISLHEGDLFEPLTRLIDLLPFDVIVSNPPYIPSAAIAKLDKSVKDFEPVIALDGGVDGLEFHRRILMESPARLVAGGRVFLEIQFDQGEAASALARNIPAFDEVRVLKDAGGRERVLTAKKAAT